MDGPNEQDDPLMDAEPDIRWQQHQADPKIQVAINRHGHEVGHIRQAGSVHAYGPRRYEWFPTIKRAKAFVEQDYQDAKNSV